MVRFTSQGSVCSKKTLAVWGAQRHFYTQSHLYDLFGWGRANKVLCRALSCCESRHVILAFLECSGAPITANVPTLWQRPISFPEFVILGSVPKNQNLWGKKSEGWPALVTAATVATHVQKPLLNLIPCAQSIANQDFLVPAFHCQEHCAFGHPWPKMRRNESDGSLRSLHFCFSLFVLLFSSSFWQLILLLVSL